jgi:hypothetical protein
MIEVTSAATGNLPRSSEADAAVDGRLTCRYAAQISFCQSLRGHVAAALTDCHHLQG